MQNGHSASRTCHSPRSPMSLTDRVDDENAVECTRDRRAEIERNWCVPPVHEADRGAVLATSDIRWHNRQVACVGSLSCSSCCAEEREVQSHRAQTFLPDVPSGIRPSASRVNLLSHLHEPLSCTDAPNSQHNRGRNTSFPFKNEGNIEAPLFYT